MTRIGIIQGRLLPPHGGRIQAFPEEAWRDEFLLAREAGMFFIEWIFENPASNPLFTDSAEIEVVRTASGVGVHSVCADYFMTKRLNTFDVPEREAAIANLNRLITACRALRLERIVLPLVDTSSISDERHQEMVIDALEKVTGSLGENELEIHIESDLPPRSFAAFLEHLPSDVVKVNYDSGNSASLGYSHMEEFEAYGNRIGSVHVKDRLRGGATVPLGEGAADLPGVFRGLRSLGYDGDLVLQVARGRDGGEVAWARKWRGYVEELWG